MTYFRMGTPTLSSARNRFTTECDMDQVVPTRYDHQANLVAKIISYSPLMSLVSLKLVASFLWRVPLSTLSSYGQVNRSISTG